MYLFAGLLVFASQLNTLVLATPICSATFRCSSFSCSRRHRMWSPTVCGCAGIQIALPLP